MPMSSLPQTLSGLPIEARGVASQGHGDFAGPIELTRMALARSAEIHGEGESAVYLYKLVSGAVRTCKATADGRRQIGGFYMAGEAHVFSAEAISEASATMRRRRILR